MDVSADNMNNMYLWSPKIISGNSIIRGMLGSLLASGMKGCTNPPLIPLGHQKKKKNPSYTR